MKKIIILVGFLLALGDCEVPENSCNLDNAYMCKKELEAYERSYFPFYGKNEQELDGTCRAMNGTLECLIFFVDNCLELQNCDAECQQMVGEIQIVTQMSGVFKLYEQLCTDDHPLRQTYLTDYDCLEKATDKYVKCENASNESQHYISSMAHDREQMVEATCCFFSWYKDCFTNATMETCGLNKTFFVSFALHLMTDHIVSSNCDPSIHCYKPPMEEPEVDVSGASQHSLAGSCIALFVFVQLAYSLLVKSRQ